MATPKIMPCWEACLWNIIRNCVLPLFEELCILFEHLTSVFEPSYNHLPSLKLAYFFILVTSKNKYLEFQCYLSSKFNFFVAQLTQKLLSKRGTLSATVAELLFTTTFIFTDNVDVVEVRVFKMRRSETSHAHWATDLPHM